MNQFDFVGDLPPPPAFKDIRATRPTVAEEKAALLLKLGPHLTKVPHSVANGSVNLTREWRRVRDAAAKVAGNKRASVHEIQSAINSFGRFSA